jgi:hypothetical protein
MPQFVAVEACSLGFQPNILLGLACFEGSPLLHEISFGFELGALELFGLFYFWVLSPLVPFSLMSRLLVKKLVVLFEFGFFTSPHIH